MSKLEHLCRNRGTMEMCHIMRNAIDNKILCHTNYHDILEELLEHDDIDLFRWISKQSKFPKKYNAIIQIIQDCQNT